MWVLFINRRENLISTSCDGTSFAMEFIVICRVVLYVCQSLTTKKEKKKVKSFC